MPVPSVLAHEVLSRLCERNAGIALSRDLVRRLLDDQVHRVNSLTGQTRANSDFEGLAMTFETSVDATNVNVEFSNIQNGGLPESYPQVRLTGIGVRIAVSLAELPPLGGQPAAAREVAEIRFVCDEIVGRVIVEDERLRIFLVAEQHTTQSRAWHWEADPALRAHFEVTHGFNIDTWGALKLRVLAVELSGVSDVASAVFDAIEFPDVLSMFVGVKFSGEPKLFAENELIVFTADSRLVLDQCPVFPAEGEVRMQSSARLGPGGAFPPGTGPRDAMDPAELRVSSSISEDSPARRYPSERYQLPEDEKVQEGHMFFYTPIELLRVNFDGVLRPAVNASDRGRLGPFYWRYSTTLAVQGTTLQLHARWPINFRLRTRAYAEGQAGAGIKIGCVRYEALGAIFEGSVDPLITEFKIFFDFQRSEIVFESRLVAATANDFFFRTFPRVLWPLSMVMDLILAKAAENLVEKQAGRVLNVTRIPLARLGLLRRVAEIRRGMTGFSDQDGNVVFGVNLV